MPIIFIFYTGSAKITILSFTELFEIETGRITHQEENYNWSDNGVEELVSVT